MSGKHIYFDTEIAKADIEHNEEDGPLELFDYAPLGISIASFYYPGEDKIKHFYNPSPDPLTRDQVSEMVWWMEGLVSKGWTFVSWNGLGFDYRLLADESGEHKLCADLAMRHIDLMYSFFCEYGYALGLDNACRTLGLGGKPDDVHAERAPVLWLAGEQQKVIDYIEGDVRLTHKIHKYIMQNGRVSWTSKRSGRKVTKSFHYPVVCGIETYSELPDVSFMPEPWFRNRFHGWTNLVNEGSTKA